jgi:glucose-6-phosphate-specific signal transduction histidine kinase
MKEGLPAGTRIRLLRSFSLGILFAGALASLAFTLQAGQNNKSFLLIFLFAIWTLSPFCFLIAASLISRFWQDRYKLTLYISVILITALSLLAYSRIFSLPGSKPAFVFLITPLLSWIFSAMIYFPLRMRAAGK